MLEAHSLPEIDCLKYIELKRCFNCFLNLLQLCLFPLIWTNAPLEQYGPRDHLPPAPPFHGLCVLPQLGTRCKNFPLLLIDAAQYMYLAGTT